MNTTLSRNAAKASKWPRKVKLGRESVSVYRREAPGGQACYMVANYATGKRRFDSYATEAEAIEAATRLVRQLSERDVLSASMTQEQTIEYAAAVQALKPFSVSLTATANAVAECLKLVSDLPNLVAAAKLYATRNKQITAKSVSDVVTELLAVKTGRGSAERYIQDLAGRLNKFAEAFCCNACNVTTAQIQGWLDGQKLSTQSYQNNRRVLHLFYKFAVARGYAAENPVLGVEGIKVKNGATQIYSVSELTRLLAAADADFVPVLAIGAFAGLRSAEIERLEWRDVDLATRHIVVGADKAKTASRRIVPISDNLLSWLAPYASQTGKVWKGGWMYKAQAVTAKATEVKGDPANGIKAQAAVTWKANALRHSYASYRLAQTQNAAQVALECGNSPQMVFRHYRELVKPADAQSWFEVKPEMPANVESLTA